MEPINFTDVLLVMVGFLIVYTLNGIKGEVKEVKMAMKELNTQLTDIDRRVVRVESQCGINHTHHRKADDE